MCVINYKTGEVLDWVSMPNYDPVDLLDGSSEGDGIEDNGLPQPLPAGAVHARLHLQDRHAGRGARGRTRASLQRTFVCSGKWDYEGGSIVCAGDAVHGEVDLITAFAKSCNITFGKLGLPARLERLRATAEQFGLNENFKFGDFMIYNSSFPTEVSNVGGLGLGGRGAGRGARHAPAHGHDRGRGRQRRHDDEARAHQAHRKLAGVSPMRWRPASTAR